jgi:hypothetical protein
VGQQNLSTPGYSGVFSAGATVRFSLQSGGGTYTVQDLHGTVLSAGSVGLLASSLTPQVPDGGWPNGWYLLQISHSVDSYAIFPFSVINDDPHFPSLPAWGATSQGSDPFYDGHDLIGIATAGLGNYRWQVSNAISTAEVSRDVSAIQSDLDFLVPYLNGDRARPFAGVCQFPNGSVDSCQLGNLVFCRRGSQVNLANVTIASANAGATFTLTVTDSTQNTVVETFSDIYLETELQAQINAQSQWLTCGGATGIGTNAPAVGSQVLSSAYTVGVIAAVQALYGYNAAGITYFEGPANEPGSREPVAAAWAAFQSSVHAANARAVAVGPAVVQVDELVPLSQFTAAMGFSPDAVSFHGYNCTFDELVTLDWTYQDLSRAISTGGWQSAPMFMTEYGDFFGEYATVMPAHSARAAILFFVFMESIGVSKEHTYWFYPASHGFGFCSWWRNGDGTYAPVWTAARNLSERLYGRVFQERLSLPDPVNRILLALRWADPERQVLLLLPNGPTQLEISVGVGEALGDDLTVWDWAGNATTPAIADGQLTLSPDMTGLWIEAPAGVELSVDDVNSGLLGSVSANYADPSDGADVLSISTDASADALNLANLFSPDPLVGTNGSAPPWQDSTHTLPYSITIDLPSTRYLARMLILGASARTDTPTGDEPARDALLGFQIDYLPPASDPQWTTCYLYTPPDAVAAASSPLSGPWSNMGSGVDWTQLSFYDRTFCFDCVFADVIDATAVRLTVTAVSNGSAPDDAQQTADAVSVSSRLMLRFLGLYPDSADSADSGALGLTSESSLGDL